jgi:hypothetical protein
MVIFRLEVGMQARSQYVFQVFQGDVSKCVIYYNVKQWAFRKVLARIGSTFILISSYATAFQQHNCHLMIYLR